MQRGMSARTRLDLSKAIAQERENRRKAGELIPRDEILRAATAEAAIIRATLLNAGNSLAPKLAGKDAAGIKLVLDEWADAALNEWSDWAERAAGVAK